jgi:hypothetical protein
VPAPLKSFGASAARSTISRTASCCSAAWRTRNDRSLISTASCGSSAGRSRSQSRAAAATAMGAAVRSARHPHAVSRPGERCIRPRWFDGLSCCGFRCSCNTRRSGAARASHISSAPSVRDVVRSRVGSSHRRGFAPPMCGRLCSTGKPPAGVLRRRGTPPSCRTQTTRRSGR